jgi:hypothetical protein
MIVFSFSFLLFSYFFFLLTMSRLVNCGLILMLRDVGEMKKVCHPSEAIVLRGVRRIAVAVHWELLQQVTNVLKITFIQ